MRYLLGKKTFLITFLNPQNNPLKIFRRIAKIAEKSYFNFESKSSWCLQNDLYAYKKNCIIEIHSTW